MRGGKRASIGFHNQVSELIVFQCDANFNCLPQNVDSATLEGVTLGPQSVLARYARLTASLDLQNPTDDATGNLLPRRARDARRGPGPATGRSGAAGRRIRRVVAAL